ncbi:MAG: SAM-dependent chlorinase/fluorinase [Gammaproteobacteria bacterium]|jgi:S-adenosylmethionine hydrolase
MTAPAIVSLTTDFGLDDPFVGIMKGVILSRDPSIPIIDLCHGVPPGAVGIGGLWLGLSCRWLPAGTVHAAVVDPGVGTERGLLCLRSEDHIFLAPDNGLAAEICRHREIEAIYQVDWPALVGEPPSRTFHGRDVFAPIAADLARGAIRADQLGPEVDACGVDSPLPSPRPSARGVDGEILLADHFGNLMTNVPAGQLPAGGSIRVTAGPASFGMVGTYDEAPPGQPVGLVNSFDLLEIACPGAHAAQVLDLGPGALVRIENG